MNPILRRALALAFALSLSPSLFALDLETEAVFLSIGADAAQCKEKDLPSIASTLFDDDLHHFENELKKSFSLSWTDDNLEERSRAMLAKTLSPLLSKLLPCANVLFSAPVSFDDGSKSFRFKDMDKGDVYSVITRNGKIVSMTLI